MKVALISSAAPLIRGGARFIVDWLAAELVKRGHEVEVVYIPTADAPDTVLTEMAALGQMDIPDSFDRVITFRPPAHVVRHPRKVAWFIHHLRVYYDLWDTDYRPLPDTAASRALRATIMEADTHALNAARKVFSNSRVVADRLRHFNGVDAEVLYPPVFDPGRFRAGDYGDEIVTVCRLEHHKRQHLLVEAMAHTRTPVRLRICGSSGGSPYGAHLLEIADRVGAQNRVVIEDRWIEEDEKIDALAGALASAYVPFDEDSYGYPTLEAAHARRSTITLSDAGGVGEFVQHDVNGLIVDPDPKAIAAAMDRLYEDRALAARLGQAAHARIAALGLDWDTVVAKLLA